MKYSLNQRQATLLGVAPSIFKIATSYNLSFFPTSIIPDRTIIPEKRVIKAIEFIIIIKRFKIDFIALQLSSIEIDEIFENSETIFSTKLLFKFCQTFFVVAIH